MKRTKDMTTGSPGKLMLFFALPLIAGNVGQQLYMVADAVIVGRGVGVEALAAVGATDWTYWLILWMIQALTQGFAARISQNIGSGDEENTQRTIAMSVLLCAVIGILLTVASLLIAAPMLRLLQTPENIFHYATLYLRILFGGTIIVMAYNMAAAILRAFGDGKTPMIAVAIAACTNIGLDLLFVMVFHWGIAGAAIATVAAQLFAFLYCLYFLIKLQDVHPRKIHWEPHPAIIKNLCGLGLPLAAQQVFIAAGGMILQSAVNRHGFLFVAAFTAVNKVVGLFESSSLAFGYAVTTYMAQNFGAGAWTRIRQGMKSIAVIAMSMSVCISLVMLLFGENILGLFISSSESNAAEVLRIAYQYLRILCCFLWTLYLLNGYRSVLQGLGKGFTAMISGVIEFAMRVSVALVFSRIRSATIFFAEPSAWTATACYLVVLSIWNVYQLPASHPTTDRPLRSYIQFKKKERKSL